MGKKAEAGTPKAIANAMKAKGLQRLRWYCQVCQKQCRDENAFKQHSLSEGHVRQMLVVGEHANTYINQFSNDFLKDFIALLSRRWGTKRVPANQVYQEFIQDKHHTHMNSTQWVTLSGFIQYLGKEGICTVDETEKGWFIAWIDNSPEALARQDAALKRERQDMNDEERQRRLLREQMERAKAAELERMQAGPSGSASKDESRNPAEEEEKDVDLATLQPIKLTIGGAPSNNGSVKGKERSASQEVDSKDQHGQTETGESEFGGKPDADGDQRKPLASAIAPPSVTAAKPKVNPFKMMGKPNPLKSNPLKASKPAGHATGSGDAHSGSSTKRPLSAVEAIVAEELEKKRKREQSTWSGQRGHGSQGLQRR